MKLKISDSYYLVGAVAALCGAVLISMVMVFLTIKAVLTLFMFIFW
ncbi:hypothetical protein [Loigolactobacillus bifermentans]|jgi:hypothetical protein|nr:hypothetical protein [Loigolactobacillus bifermentans]QGG60098.1 hypothetical protein LB003_06335 [Loigolactobacillus bifermentans]